MASQKKTSKFPLLEQPGEGEKFSENEAMPGEIVKVPAKCTQILSNASGEDIHKCPHCGAWSTLDELDSLGAEPDCYFCNSCNGEFEI